MHEATNQFSPHHRGHQGKLKSVAIINIIGFIIELLGGILFGSIALLSDAIHMLFDASAYITAFAASYVAEKYEGSEYWNFGFHRLEVLAALFNGLFLLPIAGWIVWESYKRFLTPTSINIFMSLVIGVIGLVLNLISVIYLHSEREMSLNEKGAFYHLLGDAAGSIAVILGVSLIHLTGMFLIDPIIGILIAILVVWSGIRLLAEGVGIILQKSPLPTSHIKREVESIAGIEEAHDIKSWSVCSKVRVCTLHTKLRVKTLEEAEEIREKVKNRLKKEFNITHLTIQIERGVAEDSRRG